ncbi:MAG: TolC family protein [Endomicrobium sp.]|jgi:outer membrane protein TolC|nr:TolC family protein [Endomicrobium sp.]
MKHFRKTHFLLLLFICIQIKAQDTLHLSLSKTVQLAQQNSPEAIAARHTFRAAYWNWRSYRATLLPGITLSSDPLLNRSISPVTLPDGKDSYVRRDQLSIDMGITVNQNILFTGGSLFIQSALERLDLLSENTISYKTSPIIIGYKQDLFGYNKLKWDRKTEPIRYTEAKKSLVETLELVAARVAYYFFQLATAQTNFEIASYNFANADTLYQFAQGRYNIGTITENEMLQLELNLLTEQTNLMNARIEVEDYNQVLRSYLGINDATFLKLTISDGIPYIVVPETQALSLAYMHNPEPETIKRKRIESESDLALAKSQRGFKAELYMQFGLTQKDQTLRQAYHDPLDQQLVSLGIRIPVLDWGVGKGKIKVALSNRDKVYTELEQQQIDFELNVLKIVRQFNIQVDKVILAKKTDDTAQRRCEVAHRLYLLGKSIILDLNASVAEKDRARRAYITSLYNYWNLYYAIRSLTGYDFEKDRELTENFEQLIL